MNKTVAITGSTGGLGKEISLELARQGYDLIFINRSETKSNELTSFINSIYKDTKIEYVHCDLANLSSVKEAIKSLKNMKFETLILNAGIYNAKVTKLDTGYNNIFEVNFLSQYYLVKQLLDKNDLERVVQVNSVAHNFAKFDVNDIDYTNHKKCNKIYGNSKRFLLASLPKLLEDTKVKSVVTHPGITLTNMTSHFPKLVNWIVKLFIKMFFPSNKKAALNIVSGVTQDTNHLEWIGPRAFNLWGKPKVKKIKMIKDEEIEKIYDATKEIFTKLDD